MSTANLRAYITIDTTVLAKGSAELAAVRREIESLITAKEGVVSVNTRLVASSQDVAMSTRGALLNFRMFSFAIRTLRREFGVTNPVIEQFSQVLIVGSALGTGLVAGHKLLTVGVKQLSGAYGEGVGTAAGFYAALKAGVLSVTALSIAAAALIGFAVGTWAGEQAPAFKEMTAAIKGYKEAIEDLTGSLSGLKVEQAGLGAEAAVYQAQIARINYEISLQGEATDAQTASLEMLSGAMARLKMEAAGLTAAGAVMGADVTRFQFEQAQVEEERKEYRGAALGRLNPLTGAAERPGGMVAQIAEKFPMVPGFSILIDFTGSVFGAGTDVEGATRRGVLDAIEGVGRILERNRRGP